MSDATLHVLLDIVETDLGMVVPQDEPTQIAVGDLGFDSVAVAIGLVAIEERLGVRLTERELLSCWTIADMVELIDTALRSAAGSAE